MLFKGCTSVEGSEQTCSISGVHGVIVSPQAAPPTHQPVEGERMVAWQVPFSPACQPAKGQGEKDGGPTVTKGWEERDA